MISRFFLACIVAWMLASTALQAASDLPQGSFLWLSCSDPKGLATLQGQISIHKNHVVLTSAGAPASLPYFEWRPLPEHGNVSRPDRIQFTATGPFFLGQQGFLVTGVALTNLVEHDRYYDSVLSLTMYDPKGTHGEQKSMRFDSCRVENLALMTRVVQKNAE